jgi:hypothetical protein
VPVERRDNLYVLPGRRTDEPAVKYRGIFINDEAPALAGWAQDVRRHNHQFYEHVFELILRCGATTCGRRCGAARVLRRRSAQRAAGRRVRHRDRAPHHEPMMRAHVEWARYGEGRMELRDATPKSCASSGAAASNGWGSHESVVTLGMRGDGDEPMTEETSIALLERIVADQRRSSPRSPASPRSTPQVWALYKEVQDYYDRACACPTT